MHLEEANKEKHLRWLIAVSFFVSVAVGITGWLFPPDFSVEPPKINPIGLLLGQMQTAFVILGCTALGVKLTEEKQTISSIGFTMMAITQGVVFVLFVVSPEPSKENLDEVYKLFTASLFLLLPSMLLIAFYSRFPKWLNILGVLACLPWTVENILYFKFHRISGAAGIADMLGQLMFNVTTLSWGICTLREGRQNESGL